MLIRLSNSIILFRIGAVFLKKINAWLAIIFLTAG
jgi:hypothetical protein